MNTSIMTFYQYADHIIYPFSIATENAVMLIQEKVETEEMKKMDVSLEQTSSGFKTTTAAKVIATTAPLSDIKERK
jgi:hypothetical protein